MVANLLCKIDEIDQTVTGFKGKKQLAIEAAQWAVPDPTILKVTGLR